MSRVFTQFDFKILCTKLSLRHSKLPTAFSQENSFLKLKLGFVIDHIALENSWTFNLDEDRKFECSHSFKEKIELTHRVSLIGAEVYNSICGSANGSSGKFPRNTNRDIWSTERVHLSHNTSKPPSGHKVISWRGWTCRVAGQSLLWTPEWHG